MLVISSIRENQERYAAGLRKRGLTHVHERLKEVLSLDDKRKDAKQRLEACLAEANQLAKSIGRLIKAGKKEEAHRAKSSAANLKATSSTLSQALESIKSELQEKLYQLPNVPAEEVPEGNTEADHEMCFTVESLPDLVSGAVPHWDLIKQYDLIDFELGVKITGTGFPVYKGRGAKLQRALVSFFLDEAEKAGYQEVTPPLVVNEASGIGTGQLPDKEGQMYAIADTDLYLIPTAEVPITNLYRDVIVGEKELPIKKVGFTPCFRKEAGSWGSHVRGLNRLHQFDKVEIVQIVHPEKSFEVLERMVSDVESLLKKLELPYRILKLCAGDLGFSSAMTYDFEVYAAAQRQWLEVSSVSNFEAYQAHRLRLRYRDERNEKRLLHTLNGSALALPRIVAALLENGQTNEGIHLPSALHAYTGFQQIL